MLAIACVRARARGCSASRRTSTSSSFFALAVLWIAAAGGAFAVREHRLRQRQGLRSTRRTRSRRPIAMLGIFGVDRHRRDRRAARCSRTSSTAPSHFFFTAPDRASAHYLRRPLPRRARRRCSSSSRASRSASLLGTLLAGRRRRARSGRGRSAAYVLPYADRCCCRTSLLPRRALLRLAALDAPDAAGLRRAAWSCLDRLPASRRALLRDLDNKTLAALLDPFGIARADALVTRLLDDRRAQHAADPARRRAPVEPRCCGSASARRSARLLLSRASASRYAGRGSEAREARRRRRGRGARARRRCRARRRSRTTAGDGLRQLPRLACALPARDGQERLLRRDRARRRRSSSSPTRTTVGSLFGTNTYPVTYQVLELRRRHFALFMLIIITFYAGELVWRERDARLDQIADALPMPTWLPLRRQAARADAGAGAAAGAGDAVRHRSCRRSRATPLRARPVRAATSSCIELLELLAARACSRSRVHVDREPQVPRPLRDGRSTTCAAVRAPTLGFEHHLYQLRQRRRRTSYSDMNGYGHFLRARALVPGSTGRAGARAAAGRGAPVLGARHRAAAWRERLRACARARFGGRRGRRSRLALARVRRRSAAASSTTPTSSTTTAPTHDAAERAGATTRRTTSRYAAEPQPKIVARRRRRRHLSRSEQRVRMRGTLRRSRTRAAAPVDELLLYVAAGERADVKQLDVRRAETLAEERRRDLGCAPLHARRSRSRRARRRRSTSTSSTDATASRTTGANTDGRRQRHVRQQRRVLPALGYQTRARARATTSDRRKHGLRAEGARCATCDDPTGLHDQLHLATTPTGSTSRRRSAPTPTRSRSRRATCRREWTEDGRRYFHYKMDVPILELLRVPVGALRGEEARPGWNDVADRDLLPAGPRVQPRPR